MRLFFTLTLALWTTVSMSAVDWYVNSTASGANNGTSWANAWTSFGSIQWGPIAPGDRVWISGGPNGSEKVYSTTLTIGKSGTAGNPITVGVKADDPLHNGTVIISGNYIEMSTRQFVTITGNVNGQRRFMIRDFFNTSVREFANGIMAPTSINCKFDSLIISNVNNAINVNDSGNFWIVNLLTKQIRGDCAIRANGTYGAGGSYDANKIENCDIEVAVGTTGSTAGYGPDGIQTGNNMAIRNNVFRVTQYPIITSVQHVDMIQAPGAFLDIYNNDFINVGDSCIQLHGWYPGSAHSNIRIHNNIFRIVTPIDPFPQYIRLYNVGYPITDISNLKIVHNVFLDNSWQNIETDIRSVSGNPTGSGNMLANNIFVTPNSSTVFWNLEWSSNWADDAWLIDGNVYYTGGNVVRHRGTQYTTSTWVANEPNGSVGQPAWASYTHRSPNNDLHLSGADGVARDQGVTISGFGSDKDGNARPQGSGHDAGPYEYPTSGGSTLSITSASYTYSEDSGTAAVVFRRIGSSVGAVGLTYATANGSATAGVNYTAQNGTVSWASGDAADKTLEVPIIDTDMLETKTFTVTISSPTGGAALGAQTSTTVHLTGTGVPPEPILPGLSWGATNAVIAAPFVAANGYVTQPGDNNDPAQGGSMRFTFTNLAGLYKVTISNNSPSTAANSCFIDFNQQPANPTAIFDVVLPTSGFENRDVTWRGAGTFDNPEFSPKLWNLSAGTNTLIIRGREPMQFRQVTVTLVQPEDPDPEEPPPDPDPPPPPPATILSVTTSAVTGFYKVGAIIPITITFSTNVNVTGVPQLLLNSGVAVDYASGSGGTNLLFNYTVGAGENSQRLDYTSSSALTLNGGTIQNASTNSILTLPLPGAAGSLGSSVVITIDTTRPVVLLSVPSRFTTTTNDVSFDVTVQEINLSGFSLNSTNVTLVQGTGTATGTVTVSGTQVTVSQITGEGTLGITIDTEGVASDLAGNLSAPVGPSVFFDVVPPSPEAGTITVRGTLRIQGTLSIGQ